MDRSIARIIAVLINTLPLPMYSESPWREAAPTRPRKPHAKDERGLQQQPAPTRRPTRGEGSGCVILDVPLAGRQTDRQTDRQTHTIDRSIHRLHPTSRVPNHAAPTRRPTKRPTSSPTRKPLARPTAAPTRRPAPPTTVSLGGKSFDRMSVLAVSAVAGIGLVAMLALVAYWCCRRRGQGEEGRQEGGEGIA